MPLECAANWGSTLPLNGSQMAPRWLQNTKIKCLNVNFGAKWSQMCPKGGQMVAKWCQMEPNGAQMEPKGAQMEPLGATFGHPKVRYSSRAELYRTSAPQNGAQKSPQGPQMEPKWRPKRSPIAKIPLFLLWGREMWLAFRAPIVGCVCCAASVRSWHVSACVLPLRES